MKKKMTETEKKVQRRNIRPDAHVSNDKEVQGFRDGMRAYMPAWREANIQKAHLNLKRKKLQRDGGPVRHPVLVRDVLR